MNTVSITFKEYLESRINKITDKNQLCHIFNIIEQYNKDMDINKTTDGMYIRFNNLVPETYTILNNYIRKIEATNNLNMTEIDTKFIPYNGSVKTTQKLSTEEKSLINHHKYMKNIEKNQNE